MSYVYVVPQWFFGASITLEVLFALATFFVAFYSFKVSRIYQQRSINLMTAGFAFIALSYIIKAAINVFLLKEIQTGVLALTLSGLNDIARFGFYAYVVLFTMGLLFLTYMSFKSNSTDMFLFMAVMAFATVWLSLDKVLAFNIISSVMLCILAIYYGKEYFKNNNKRTLLIFLGFLGLLLSGIGFTFANGYYANYVIGHLLELASYILILASIFSLIIKNK